MHWLEKILFHSLTLLLTLAVMIMLIWVCRGICESKIVHETFSPVSWSLGIISLGLVSGGGKKVNKVLKVWTKKLDERLKRKDESC